MKRNRMVYICCLLLSLFLISCGQGGVKEEDASLFRTSNFSAVSTGKNRADEDKANQIQDFVLSDGKIYDCIVIKGEKEVLVAYKVRHLHRFRLKQIEGTLKKNLEERYRDEIFIVSSDYKIFLEASRLKNRFERGELTSKEAEKRLQEIIKLSKEMT